MSFYIETKDGRFISGLYATEAEAQAAIKRYIAQSSKRYAQQSQQREEIYRLSQSLTVVRNADTTPPAYLIDELAAEIYLKIAGNAAGTIYAPALLLGMIRSRIIGTKGDYWEITGIQRQQALSKLIGKTGPLTEDKESGTITRTKNPHALVGAGNRGLYKSYMQRV